MVFNIVKDFLKTLDNFQKNDSKNLNFYSLKSGRSSSTLYQFCVNEKSYVIRLCPPNANQASKEHQVLIAKQAGIIGVGPQVYFIDSLSEAIIMEYVLGKILHPIDFKNKSLIIKFTQLLRKLHKSSEIFPLAVSPFKRFYDFLEKGFQNKIFYPVVIKKIKSMMEEIEWILSRYPKILVPTHLDLNLSNIIFTDEKFLLVDWVNGGMCDPYFDLATFTLFSGLNEQEIKEFLTVYFDNIPTELEWARFIVVRPVRLFVIATSCFAVAPEGKQDKFYEENLNNNKSFDFENFIHLRESEKMNWPYWKIGLSMFQKGIDLIHDDLFKSALELLKKKMH